LVLLYLGQPSEAEPLLEEAIQLNRELGDDVATVQNLSNLGTLAIDIGNYSRAMDLFREAQALAEDSGDNSWSPEQIAVAKANQGVVLESLGAFRRALDLYEPLVADPHLALSRQADLRVNMAVLYRNLGDPVRAEEELKTALASFRELGDRTGESNTLLNLGLTYQLNLERLAEAEKTYRRVLILALEGGQRQNQVDALDALGRLLLGQERWEESQKSFEDCLVLARGSEDPEGIWSCLEGLGRLALAQGRPAQAIPSLEQAIELIEEQRARLTPGLLRAGYFGGRRSVYEGTVTAYARLAQGGSQEAAGRALEIVQQAKARELLESLRPDTALPRPLSAGEIQAAAEDAFLLELFVADGTLYAWPILESGLRIQDLGPADQVLASVAAVHRHLSRGGKAEEKTAEASLQDRLQALSSLILPPRDASAWEKKLWIVSADRGLRYLPFEILPTAQGSLLVEEASLSYLPSLSSLAWLQGERPVAEVRFAGFGSPQWRARSPGTTLQRELLLDPTDLRPLPEAEAEMVRSAASLGGRSSLHVGGAATEEAFRSAVSEGARVVHLATHAAVRESLASGAAIVLTPSGEDDGLLRPEEIAALDTRVDLTVLAACSTALDTADDSRALTSLTGSLLASGSRAVLATLWDVGDQPTAAFMEQLYFRLGQGLAPAEALRRTKLQFLADPNWQNPSLWGAYVLLGNPPPIVSRPSWLPWGLALCGILVVVWLAVRRQRGRRGRLS